MKLPCVVTADLRLNEPRYARPSASASPTPLSLSLSLSLTPTHP